MHDCNNLNKASVNQDVGVVGVDLCGTFVIRVGLGEFLLVAQNL